MSDLAVIMPVYNCRSTICEAIESVFAQEIDCELIIVDGGSTDGTPQRIEPYIPKLSYYVSEPDKGIEDAISKGLDHVTSDWIMVLAGDDALLPKGLSAIYKSLSDDVDVLSSAVVYEDGNRNCYLELSDPDLSKLRTRCSLRMPASVFRTSVFTKASEGLLETGLIVAGDRERFLRMKEQGCRMDCSDMPLVFMREGGISTRKSLNIAFAEDERISIAHGEPIWSAKSFHFYRRVRTWMGNTNCFSWINPRGHVAGFSEALSDSQLENLGLKRYADGSVHVMLGTCPE